ncbi:MAG: hypothetical protein H7301_14345 [Cryobacterium sp.]|nr:hypothetical protein [Oligoflexia bacterium]
MEVWNSLKIIFLSFLFAGLLTLSACGIPGGVASCVTKAPSGGVLTFQGSFSPANNSGVSGIVRTYLVNGLIVVTIESLALPNLGALTFSLETRDSGVFYQTTVREAACTQTLATGQPLGATNRFTQATLRLNNSSSSTLYGTALLTSVLPNSLY